MTSPTLSRPRRPSEGERTARHRLRSVLAAAAGPALIGAVVLVLLRSFAFGGKLSAQNLDTITFYFPDHCFLGRSLAAGHVPAWNPFTMSGTPFAADSQSGWLSVPIMLLYTLL